MISKGGYANEIIQMVKEIKGILIIQCLITM